MDYLPNIDPHAIKENLEFVDQRDIHSPVDIFQYF